MLQRAVEDEVEAFLGRALERTAEARGWRNGHRCRRVQTVEGEITVAMPPVRGTPEALRQPRAPETRTIVRTRPLEARVIGTYVRGLSESDIQSLAEEAGLG